MRLAGLLLTKTIRRGEAKTLFASLRLCVKFCFCGCVMPFSVLKDAPHCIFPGTL